MGEVYIPESLRFAALIVAETVVVVMLLRQLLGTRTRWKGVERTHAAPGVALTEDRTPAQMRRDLWGKTFSRWQAGHLERKRADLAVLQMRPEDYSYKRVMSGLGAGGFALVVVVLMIVAGRPLGMAGWLGVVALPVFFYGAVLPGDLTKKADQRRTQVSFEFSQYLQLAAMFVRGNRPWQSALRLTARVAKESTFQAIAVFLERGASLNQTPSVVFENLGKFWHHEDISRFATTIKTAEAGGSMKDAIISQSQSIAERNLHVMLEEADKATTRAGLPETGIVALYMLYLMYPSLAQI